MNLLNYNQVKDELGGGDNHLLLGNGFSISCDPIFAYKSLYDYASQAGLSDTAKIVFQTLGTNNFEGVMRLLDDAHWVAVTYGLIPEGESKLNNDREIIKASLISAIAETHLDDTSKVDVDKKTSALVFLNDFNSVYTTNYDLLLYWVVMHGSRVAFQDGFRNDPHDESSLIFSQRMGRSKGIYYLHGALHLYFEAGEHRKHSWAKTGTKLTELVREGLKQERYPLFVAEGSAEKKLEQIQRSGYLWYCLDKLARIKKPLVIFGHALGESDAHLVDRLVQNKDMPTIYIGLHGDPESPGNLSIRSVGSEMILKRNELHHEKPLEVKYFDSDSARVWNNDV